MVEDRLKRVHVVGARAKGSGFVVVMSDPVRDAAGKEIRADTWEVSWDAWVAAGADVARL
jgi:hypothetical protein